MEKERVSRENGDKMVSICDTLNLSLHQGIPSEAGQTLLKTIFLDRQHFIPNKLNFPSEPVFPVDDQTSFLPKKRKTGNQGQ
jgi:hypothetical protein